MDPDRQLCTMQQEKFKNIAQAWKITNFDR
jgi:hypothetical protein